MFSADYDFWFYEFKVIFRFEKMKLILAASKTEAGAR